MSTFLNAVLFYVVKFICIAAIAVAGVFIGAGLRKRKNEKSITSESNNQED